MDAAKVRVVRAAWRKSKAKKGNNKKKKSGKAKKKSGKAKKKSRKGKKKRNKKNKSGKASKKSFKSGKKLEEGNQGKCPPPSALFLSHLPTSSIRFMENTFCYFKDLDFILLNSFFFYFSFLIF